MPSKIALAMITKGDEGELLDRCLSTIANAVDKIFITITTPDKDVKKVCKKYGAEYTEVPGMFHYEMTQEIYDWAKKFIGGEPTVKVGDRIFRFDNARNYSFDQVPEEYEWILWLDTDDIFRGADSIRKVIKEAEEHKADSVFFNYLYQVETDDEGNVKNVLIQHLRERFIRRGVYKWVAPIHETLIAQRPDKKLDSQDCDVVHLSNHPRLLNALERNMKTLELSLFDTKGADPRPIYYLGKAYYDKLILNNDVESGDVAMKLFQVYLHGSEEHGFRNKSGWAEERCQCWEYMSEILRRKNDFATSVTCGMNALMENDTFPSTYMAIAMSYLHSGKHERAMSWLKKGLAIPAPKTTLVTNPKEIESRAHEVVYHHGLKTNNIDQALKASQMLVDLRPDDPAMVDRYNRTMEIKATIEATKAFVSIAKQLEAEKDLPKLKTLVKSVPRLIENNPIISDMHRRIFPPRVHGEDEITIYCGPGFTTWSPKQLSDPKGSFMGGSEEAVVYLGEELAALGWKVTVYGDPGDDEGEYAGVKYLPHYKFNRDDEFNIFVSWRQIALVDANYKVKKMYIWNHDIINQMEVTPERLDKIDKMIVLSQWHRENIPNVPDYKVLISANGVTL